MRVCVCTYGMCVVAVCVCVCGVCVCGICMCVCVCVCRHPSSSERSVKTHRRRSNASGEAVKTHTHTHLSHSTGIQSQWWCSLNTHTSGYLTTETRKKTRRGEENKKQFQNKTQYSCQTWTLRPYTQHTHTKSESEWVLKSPWKFAQTRNLLWREGAYTQHEGILNMRSNCTKGTKSNKPTHSLTEHTHTHTQQLQQLLSKAH